MVGSVKRLVTYCAFLIPPGNPGEPPCAGGPKFPEPGGSLEPLGGVGLAPREVSVAVGLLICGLRCVSLLLTEQRC